MTAIIELKSFCNKYFFLYFWLDIVLTTLYLQGRDTFKVETTFDMIIARKIQDISQGKKLTGIYVGLVLCTRYR